MRPYNAAGGAYGAPGDIRSADPRFTLARSPGYANRPASVILRSDDALTSTVYDVVAPASFLLNMTTPIIGAKAAAVKQAVIRNLVPTVPEYQRWFFYKISGPGFSTPKNFVFRYLANLVSPLPICNTLAEFVTYLNASTAYAVEIPPGQSVTLAWYTAQVAAGAVAPVDARPVFAADISGAKVAIELPIATIAPYNAADVLILSGIQSISTLLNAGAIVKTNAVLRYDLTLNTLIGQPAETEDWDYGAPRSPGAAMLLPLFANINGTQTVYVTSSVTVNGAQTVSNTARSIVANIPVNVAPNNNIVFMPQSLHWIWSISSESIQQIAIDLLDENLQPIVLPFNTVIEIELAFLYEDSTL